MFKYIVLKTFRYVIFFVTLLLTYSIEVYGQSETGSTKKWVGTWATAPQLVEPGNMPPAPGLNNNSLRQVVRVSIGGDTLRVKFSNEFSTNPITLKSVQIAVSTGGHTIDISTNKELKFNGNPEVTMGAGLAVISDPIAFSLNPRMDIAITIYFGQTSESVTGHPGSRTTSYLLSGNTTSVTDFTGSITTDHWYNINRIDVLALPPTACVAILGNSITDGRGSTTNLQNRWPDIFSESLLKNTETTHIGVLNMGIGGNAVLAGGLGPTGISRYERDILTQPGIKWAIIYHGVNDIGGVTTAQAATTKTNDLIGAYKQMIIYAHQRKIKVFGATILPFKGNSYYNQYSDQCRVAVNNWIRTSNWFDGIIDFDLALRDPNDTSRLGVTTFQNDGLHPDAAGYKIMGESVNINLFIGNDTIFTIPELTGYEWHWFESERFVPEVSNFNIETDPLASKGKYIMVKPGLNSSGSAPTDNASIITIPFTADYNSTYNIFARLNCPTYDDDSFWLKFDNNPFVMSNGLVTSGWEWRKLNNYNLTIGNHSLTIAYREDGAKLDKICITNYEYAPIGTGGIDSLAEIATSIKNLPLKKVVGNNLMQNFPNPFRDNTQITFELASKSNVSLKVYNMSGIEVAELAGKVYPKGRHVVYFNSGILAQGIYTYTIRTKDYLSSKYMIITK